MGDAACHGDNLRGRNAECHLLEAQHQSPCAAIKQRITASAPAGTAGNEYVAMMMCRGIGEVACYGHTLVKTPSSIRTSKSCTEVGLCPGAAAERPPPLTRGRRRQLASCGTQAEVQSFSPCVAPPATSSCGPGKWGMRHATVTTCVVEMPNAISSKLSTSRHVRQSSRGSQLQPLLAPPATRT